MLLYVMNPKFETVDILDTYESTIWVDRYNENGDFEIHLPVSEDVIHRVPIGYYLQTPLSDRTMIVEARKITTSGEKGSYLTVLGRSLESLLTRRIIWSQTMIDGNFQNGIERLLNENVIKPKDTTRQIPGFIFKRSNDPRITKEKLVVQLTGDNLYTAISTLCKERDIGFRVTLNTRNQFVFELFKGIDRSYKQTEEDFVIFSPDYDNLLGSEFTQDERPYCNVARILGEGEGAERVGVTIGKGSGIKRKELYVDARDLSSSFEGGELPVDIYKTQLEARGQEKMEEHERIDKFEGSIDPTLTFIYGEDYYIGDIVQVTNEYGMSARSRVHELILAQDMEGYRVYPDFTTLDREEDDK